MSVYGMSNLLDFTRNSTATYWDSAGILRTAAVDEPRWDYDQATGTFRGLLVERSRTNSLLDNRDLSTGNWSGSAGIAKDAIGLDGEANSAHTITDDDSGAFQGREQTIAVADNSATHCVSVYLKKDSDTSRYPRFFVRLQGGAAQVTQDVLINTESGVVSETLIGEGATEITDAGDYWRIKTTLANNGTGNTTLRFLVQPAASVDGSSITSSATGSVVYDYGQVELNATYATSPIETAGSAVTRAADSLVGDIGSEFNTDVFSYVIHGRTPPGAAGFETLYQVDDGDNNDSIRLDRTSDGTMRYRVSIGGSASILSLGVVPDSTEFKVAFRAKANDHAAVLNGGTVLTNDSGGVPSGLTTRRVMSAAGALHWNGHTSFINELPRGPTNAELQSETS